MVRLVRPEQPPLGNALMVKHHDPAFAQCSGRGLQDIAEWDGKGLTRPGWQTAAFQCGLRDTRLEWHFSSEFRRLHLAGNNTRFLALPREEGVPSLATPLLSLTLTRLSAHWERPWRHALQLAESLFEPQKYQGTRYRASTWIRLALRSGHARSNNTFTSGTDRRSATNKAGPARTASLLTPELDVWAVECIIEPVNPPKRVALEPFPEHRPTVNRMGRNGLHRQGE